MELRIFLPSHILFCLPHPFLLLTSFSPSQNTTHTYTKRRHYQPTHLVKLDHCLTPFCSFFFTHTSTLPWRMKRTMWSLWPGQTTVPREYRPGPLQAMKETENEEPYTKRPRADGMRCQPQRRRTSRASTKREQKRKKLSRTSLTETGRVALFFVRS